MSREAKVLYQVTKCMYVLVDCQFVIHTGCWHYPPHTRAQARTHMHMCTQACTQHTVSCYSTFQLIHSCLELNKIVMKIHLHQQSTASLVVRSCLIIELVARWLLGHEANLPIQDDGQGPLFYQPNRNGFYTIHYGSLTMARLEAFHTVGK